MKSAIPSIVLVFFVVAAAYGETCQEKLQNILSETNGTPPLGSFEPQCDGDKWKQVQFYGSTGESWCVDPDTGEEIIGTRTRAPKTTNCGSAGTCQDALQKVMSGTNEEPPPGMFVPQCDGDKWKSVQHYESTGQSWCVNPDTGEEISGTRTQAPETANCASEGTCQDARQKALSESNGETLRGRFVPQCDGDKWKQVQYYGSTVQSWCVNPDTGEEINGTRRRVPETATCGSGGSCQDALQKVLSENEEPLPGEFLPQCDGDKWQRIQFYGSTGQSWCVNPDTGEEINGTRTRSPETANCGTCQDARQKFQSESGDKSLPGTYIPQCDGEKWRALQLSPTGESWCVNPDTGEEIDGTRTDAPEEAQCSEEE